MKRLVDKTSLLAAILGMTGVLFVLCAELLKRQAALAGPVALLEYPKQTSHVDGGSVHIGPLEFSAANVDWLTAALVVLALLSGILATTISVSRIMKGDNGQFSSIGVVSGFLSIVWVGKLYVYGL